MKFIHFLLFLLHLLFGISAGFEECGIRGSASRIIGGKDASIGEFPWQVSLRKKMGSHDFVYTSHNCGGAIINRKWILTAAHCVQRVKVEENELIVRVGDLRLYQKDPSEVDLFPEKIRVHENWNKTGKLENDIALIKVNAAIDLSTPFVGSTCLPSEGTDFRGVKDCWFSGWGFVYSHIWDPPNYMQKTRGGIWRQKDLERVWSSEKIQPGMLGFGHDGWPDYGPCSGDSGGPLVCSNTAEEEGVDRKWFVAGVASFATGTCARLPGVFTETAFFAEWIQKNID